MRYVRLVVPPPSLLGARATKPKEFGLWLSLFVVTPGKDSTIDPSSELSSLSLAAIAAPSGATHVSFSTAVSLVDMEGATYETVASATENLSLDAAPNDLSLVPASMPTGEGIRFQYLLIEFFQEINGIQYALRNGSFNVLNIVKLSQSV